MAQMLKLLLKDIRITKIKMKEMENIKKEWEILVSMWKLEKNQIEDKDIWLNKLPVRGN